ncbi:class I SAM-dependent methyltransferase [Lysobacter humi (ex Lee et al. 2017)]
MHSAEAKHRAEGLSTFCCNICGHGNTCDPARIGREDASCVGCGSSVRLRAIVHLLSLALFEESMPLDEFPVRPDIYGLGLSDWAVYAKPLARRFAYLNTFYHTAPRLDITAVPDELAGSADFLIATDVFEHVLAPVSRAFEGARRLLRPGGAFIFSVPFVPGDGDAVEHFPMLHDFRIECEAGEYRLVNTRSDGVVESFGDLVFHGGPGSTLEMRLFSRGSLVREFQRAGFSQVTFHAEAEPRWGIHWPSPDMSVVILARA